MWRCDVAHVMWCHQIWPRPSTKSGTATSPDASKLCACPNSCNPRCCSGHQQNHINIIRCCPGHCIITKFCPCKEKSCPKITKCHACDEKWHSNMPQKNIPTSPNVAPATKNDWHAWYAPHMKRHAHCAGQQASPSNCYEKWHSETWKTFAENGWNSIYIGRRFDHRTSRTRLFSEVILLCFEDAFYNTPRSGYLPKLHQILPKVTLQHHQILPLPRKVTLQHHQIQMMRLPRNVTLEHHQILRLPRKVTVRCVTHMIENVTCIGRSKRCDHPASPKNIAPARKITLMIDPRHIWNVMRTAPRNRGHPPTSPNIAPVRKNDLPKYGENVLKTDEGSFTLGGPFGHDPNPNCSSCTRPFRRGYFSCFGDAFCMEKFKHCALRLATQISPHTAPAMKWRCNITKT